ncbi:XLF-domain-containing protein [Venturia nashicola]|nr:XLF-domain-containing protein [Venturia nashicola]
MRTFLDWRSIGGHIYIRTTFGSDRYSIWATDLSRLWHEELERDDIIWQANRNRIQIDLEDANNFGILLKHLASSVQGDVDIAERKSSRIELKAAIKLPAPLPEATWTFRLELQEDEDFRNHVTIPLFDQIRTQQRNEEDLIQRIKDKDHIVDKLMDALDKYKADLAGIFPALATKGPARRTSTRAEAETRIPALRPFDPQTWHQGHPNGHICAAVQPKGTSLLPTASERPIKETSAPSNDARDTYETSDAPSKAIKRTIGSRTRSPSPSPPPAMDDTTASELEGEPAAVPTSSKGIKRTIGSRKQSPISSPQPASDESTVSESEKEPITVAPSSKGIKRTIGSQFRHLDPIPPLDIEETMVSEGDEQTVPFEAPYRGIKRTIGSRKPAARGSSAVPEGAASSTGARSKVKAGSQDVSDEQEEAEPDAEEALKRADDKRRALQRQLAKNSAPKPKKRKF